MLFEGPWIQGWSLFTYAWRALLHYIAIPLVSLSLTMNDVKLLCFPSESSSHHLCGNALTPACLN